MGILNVYFNDRDVFMTIGIILFILSWVAFFLFADKKKFPLYVVTGYVAIILAFITDLLMFVYPLWQYPGTSIEMFWVQMINSFGLYFVVTYLYLQTLPKKQTIFTVAKHIFYWSLFAIILEFILLSIGFIEHGLWWHLGLSYTADWLLFFIFYMHHRWMSNVIVRPPNASTLF